MRAELLGTVQVRDDGGDLAHVDALSFEELAGQGSRA